MKLLLFGLLLPLYAVSIGTETYDDTRSTLRSSVRNVRKYGNQQQEGVEVVESEINEHTTLASFLEMELLHGDLRDILDEKSTIVPDISRLQIADAVSDFVESKLLIHRERWQKVLDDKKVSKNSLLEISALHAAYPRTTRSIKPKCLLYENYFFGQCAHGPPRSKLMDVSLNQGIGR